MRLFFREIYSSDATICEDLHNRGQPLSSFVALQDGNNADLILIFDVYLCLMGSHADCEQF